MRKKNDRLKTAIFEPNRAMIVKESMFSMLLHVTTQNNTKQNQRG